MLCTFIFMQKKVDPDMGCQYNLTLFQYSGLKQLAPKKVVFLRVRDGHRPECLVVQMHALVRANSEQYGQRPAYTIWFWGWGLLFGPIMFEQYKATTVALDYREMEQWKGAYLFSGKFYSLGLDPMA